MERYERVKLTNPDKVLYPATGTTKAEVFAYYLEIAEVMLPHIAGRPVTRKRWPNGVAEASFFEKQLASSAPDWLDRATVAHRSGSTTYPLIDSVEGLAWIAQQAALEVHVPQWRFIGEGARRHPGPVHQRRGLRRHRLVPSQRGQRACGDEQRRQREERQHDDDAVHDECPTQRKINRRRDGTPQDHQQDARP